MNDLVPDYLPPYVLIGTVATVSAVLYGLHSALRLARWPVRDRRRAVWNASALLLGWFFAALLPSWFGLYGGMSSRIPTIQYGVLIPILSGVILFWRWPTLKRVVELAPQKWIVSVQAYRMLGLIFLVLYARGRMPGAFAWPAGTGDIITGLLAPIVGIAYARGWRGSTGMLRAWNLFGIADLVVALATGFLTSPSGLQMLAFDRPNKLVSVFPLVMIPVFLVPLSVLLHLASMEKLRRTGAEQRIQNRLPAIGRA